MQPISQTRPRVEVAPPLLSLAKKRIRKGVRERERAGLRTPSLGDAVLVELIVQASLGCHAQREGLSAAREGLLF